MPRLRPALALAGLLLAGCSRHASDAAAPAPVVLSPALLATQPAPRTASAIYDGDIWGQFDRALDPHTVSPFTVFLKLDGQRIPIGVSYESITHRIFLRPQVTLQLQRTYTAEFTQAIHGVDGTSIPPNVFFQFTTNSLRRPVYDYPRDDALEGSVSCLGWGGAKGPDGNIFYDVYASTDSDAVVRRAVASLQHTAFTRYLTRSAWPGGARIFWAVTSENVTTHERLAGEVHSFRTFDEAAPLDSIVVRAADAGSNQQGRPNTQFCNADTLPAGPDFNAALHWDYSSLDTNVRVAGASIVLVLTNSRRNGFSAAQPTAWLAQNEWSPCAVRAPGPPFNENTGLLANSAELDSVHVGLSADRLSSLVEAQIRRRTLLFGTLLRGLANTAFYSPNTQDPSRYPRMVIRFRRVPPASAR